MKILIKNGRIIDPSVNLDKQTDLVIENGFIKSIGSNKEENFDEIIDSNDCWVVPGLIDLHVHLREPGYEYKETIKTGAKSAAKGGFTTICAMPNTNPVIDNEYLVEYIKLKVEKEAIVNVLPIGAITKGQKGEELANIGNMAEAGICAISEDGSSVMNAGLYKKAMTYASMFKLPIFAHCEDKNLAGKGAMNSGDKAISMGLAGISTDSEEVIIARDIILADKTKSKLHLCHISTTGSVELLKQAKEKGINVTAEACPHHFALSEDNITDYDSNYKMNPPLRSKNDVEALKNALKDNIIDVIATDHAPHHSDDKNMPFSDAAFGIVGLETAVPLTITELVETGYITPSQMIEKLALNPAKILETEKGTLQEGKVADVTIINPNTSYKIDCNSFESKSKNSPFNDKEVKGKVCYTIVNGKIVYKEEK